MKYVASVSFGKDSLAMLLKLIEEQRQIDEVIFYDTGMEYQAIYRNRDRIKDLLRSKNIAYTELKSKENFLYDMLVRPVKECDHFGYEWCGGRTRWGTANKTSAIRNHLKRYDEEVFEYIGIAYDEQQRQSDNSHKVYPLIEWEMTEKDCLQYCYNHGFDWKEEDIELYDILDRVSCWCCQNKNLKELRNIYHFLPVYWNRLKGIQSRMKRPMKSYGTVFELEERFKKEDQTKQITINDILEKENLKDV